MSLVQFEKKKNPKNKIIIGISAFILLLIILGISRTIFGIGHRTTRAESHLVIDKIDGIALVIKSEKVYEFPGSSGIEFLLDEGVKVAVGQEIIKGSNVHQDVYAQLENVEKQIEDLGIKYYSEEENINLLEDIQNKISEGSYNDIHEYVEEMNSSNGHNNLVSEKLETLLIKQEELVALIEDSSRNSGANISGILSYEVDGYEEVLKPQDFKNYKYDSLDFTRIIEALEENSTEGRILFKIIHDYIWHIALKVDDERILEFEDGQVYNIQLGEGEILRGRIVTVNSDNAKGIIVIEFKDKLHEYYSNRILDVSLIKSQTNSYGIPSRSIVERDGQAGVYINHVYGVVKFVPVNIIDSDDDITYIDIGDNDAYIMIDGERIRTITQFDEVFVNPSNLKEDQILR